MSNRTILLADDHALVRKGLRSVLELLRVADTILEAGNGIEVLEVARKTPVDLFILDFKMPEMNGYEASRILLRENPRCKILVISMYNDKAMVANLLQIGVSGFLSKNSSIDEIESAIRSVLMGDLYYDVILENQIRQELLAHIETPVKFSSRENDLIALLAEGKTSREIATQWGLTLKTIETYRCRLLAKARVKNTSELLHYFHRNGLVY